MSTANLAEKSHPSPSLVGCVRNPRAAVSFFPIAQLRDAMSRVPPARFLAVLPIHLVVLAGSIT